MVENDLTKKDKREITSDLDIDRLMIIVKDHKVYWTVIPIELTNSEGKIYKAGFALVLAGTVPEIKDNLHDASEMKVFKDIRQIVNWLVPKDNPNIRCEIRTIDESFFYFPGNIDDKRRDYVEAILIWNKESGTRPVDIHQREALKEMQDKLKQIGSPKERWKERPTTI